MLVAVVGGWWLGGNRPKTQNGHKDWRLSRLAAATAACGGGFGRFGARYIVLQVQGRCRRAVTDTGATRQI